MNANPKTTTVVELTIRVLCGSTEDLTRYPRPGQRRWWLQRTDRVPGVNPWLDIGVHPGDQPAEITAELVAGGRYTLGTGQDTRVRFVCPLVPCTLALDPGTGSANVVGSTPDLRVVPEPTEPTVRDPHHVRNAPMDCEARGKTYEGGADAFAALSRCVESGTVDVRHAAAGLVAVAKGPWPVASYPPPAPGTGPDSPPTVYRPNPVFTNEGPRTIKAGEVVVAGSSPSTVRPLADALPVPTIPPAPERTEAPKPADFRWNTAAEQVSAVAVERISADERYLAGLGLVMPPPVRTYGGVVNDIGRENIARSHADWSAEPATVDTLNEIRVTVGAEARRDVPVRLGQLRMMQDGRVAHGNSAQLLHLEETALQDLVRLYPSTLPRAGAVMSVLPPAVRATVWNDGAGTARDEDTVVLRTRDGGGDRRSAFAAVSTGYSPCDADVVADWTERALRALPGGPQARGAATYDPETTALTVDAVWHADNVVDFAAGDVFKMGVRVKSADNGTGAIRVQLVAWRNRCFNLIITSETAATLARVVHRGDQRAMIEALIKGIRHVGNAAAPFLARWGHLRSAPIASVIEAPSAAPALNLRAIFAEIAGARAKDDGLPVLRKGALPEAPDFAGIDRDVLVETLLRSYNHEPGGSLADIVNAVTRLHHERVPVPVLRSAESYAGELVQAWGMA